MALRFALTVVLLVALPGGRGMAEEPDIDTLRAQMVRNIEVWTHITAEETGVDKIDPRVLDVLGEVPRHLFVPEPFRPYAYGGDPLPLGYEQNIASPFLVALMTHLAEPRAGQVVFETGTGAGYHAAVLSRLTVQVYSVEVVEPLALRASEKLNKLGFTNATVRQGDGYYGWAEHAPFDAIIVKEAVDHIPVPLLNQLKPGGRMVIPLGGGGGGGVQFLTVVHKQADGSTRKTRILPVRFSPLQGGERT